MAALKVSSSVDWDTKWGFASPGFRAGSCRAPGLQCTHSRMLGCVSRLCPGAPFIETHF